MPRSRLGRSPTTLAKTLASVALRIIVAVQLD
jgi:hypothetical protein